ncbi:hypothetical protein [Streptomyces caniscabiei]|uniref:hypothetical protein n=1 Tax=Streptomyces caniscabiei TaxID=2746961 RepID=UPI001872B5F6|nr:hypothetical protein [Streptomyces caniscabiei]MBE4761703.1 hypothetical protein [Streptomyces caniscabiei]MDX2947947.1 hypothetical protein [Streptomyces caniscabiei]
MSRLYQVTRYAHSRIYHWQWRCLYTKTAGSDPNSVRCPEGGFARSEDEATRKAAEHAQTHGTRTNTPSQ